MRIPNAFVAFIIISGLNIAHAETPAQVVMPMSDAVRKVLDGKMRLVTERLADPSVVNAVQAANLKNAKLSEDEILALDKKWRDAKGIDEFIKPYLTNPCSDALISLQDQDDGLSEVFVTDVRGLNVCQTNKTSDLYQADEEWWQKGFDKGKGHTYFGEIEYDESARCEAIPIYIPLKSSDKTIGVAKVVVDITSVKREM